MQAQRIAILIAAVSIVLSGCQAPQQRRPAPPPPVQQPQPRIVRVPPRIYYPPIPPLPPAPQPRPAPRPAPAPPPVESPAPGKYVTAAQVRPAVGVKPGRWQVIVVHHSADEDATPQSMDRYHRVTRGWKHGLGYHFVIGNGDQYPDGKIFVGNRWKQQLEGAHCATTAGKYFGVNRPAKFFNNKGIGICMIGNMEQTGPTAKQKAALQQLIVVLCKEAKINPSRVYGHGEVTHRTQCPGRLTNMNQVRNAVTAAYRSASSVAAAMDDSPMTELPVFDEIDLAAVLDELGGVPHDQDETPVFLCSMDPQPDAQPAPGRSTGVVQGSVSVPMPQVVTPAGRTEPRSRTANPAGLMQEMSPAGPAMPIPRPGPTALKPAAQAGGYVTGQASLTLQPRVPPTQQPVRPAVNPQQWRATVPARANPPARPLNAVAPRTVQPRPAVQSPAPSPRISPGPPSSTGQPATRGPMPAAPVSDSPPRKRGLFDLFAKKERPANVAPAGPNRATRGNIVCKGSS